MHDFSMEDEVVLASGEPRQESLVNTPQPLGWCSRGTAVFVFRVSVFPYRTGLKRWVKCRRSCAKV